MADKSKIEWTDASWTPIRARNRASSKVGWHCEHASPGCEHCYAESMNKRLGTGLAFKPGHRKDVELHLDEKMLLAPLRWEKPRAIFVCSMTDLFAEFVPDEWIDRIFAVMALCPQHRFQVLTKRSGRMRDYFVEPSVAERIDCDMGAIIASRVDPLARRSDDLRARAPSLDEAWPLPNVWLGVSVEDQRRADERIPDLLATAAALRFLSCEPLLGPVDLDHVKFFDRETKGGGSEAGWESALNGRRFNIWLDGDLVGEPKIDWVIAGGESGPGARGSTQEVEAWMRSLRDQCSVAGVSFFGKQNFRKLSLPDDLMVREMPDAR